MVTHLLLTRIIVDRGIRGRGDRDRRGDLLRQLLTHGVDGVGRLRAPLGGLSVVFLLLYGVEFIRLLQEGVDCKVQV